MITVAGVVIIGGSGTSGPALSDATPAALGVAAAGVSADASRADHVHALPTGIPAIGSGTYAARPASPTVGDSYTVTSGVRRGSVYRCDVAGAWSLVTVNVTQLGACVGLFDSERAVGRSGAGASRWINISPRGRGFDVVSNGVSNAPPLTTIGTAPGLLALDQTAGRSLLGALPAAAPSAARTLVALVDYTGTPGFSFNYVLWWGARVASGLFSIVSRVDGAANWGSVFWGSGNWQNSGTAVASGYKVVAAVYDGTDSRIYIDGTLISTQVVALTGGSANSLFGIGGTDNFDDNAYSRLAFAGAWDAALSAGEVTALTTLLRERYGV